ncbi:MAG: hypothetical protein LBP20_04210 [Treponema sp.]|nr:hypothetical protein [Treponema sp.]
MAFGIVLLLSFSLSAQVNENELEQNQAPISFFSYEGPQTRIETRDQIYGIGYGLGQAIFEGAARAGSRNRYFVIHATGPAEDSKLDADIIGLGYDAGVDHIRNLRLIIQGYLEAAYAYNAGDAALLAQYITIYNAVYRGNWDYVTGRYKGPVVAELSPEQAGLSIRFDEWPGQTLILIPLGLGQPHSLSAIDTSVVSDTQVVGELRKDGDMGIEQRQDMVDLKEREAEEAEQRAQEQRREAEAEQQRIDEERRQINEERRRLEEEQGQPPGGEQQRVDEARPGETEQQEPVQREQEPEAAAPEQAAPEQAAPEQAAPEQAAPEQAAPGSGQEDRESRERELAEREEALDRRQEAVDEKREEVQRSEELAEQKREEVREERENITQDQQTLINEEPREGTAPGVIGAIIEGQDSPLGRIVRVSPDSGEELGRSALNTINTRTIYDINGRLFAVAGENRGVGAIRLIEIDPESLEMKSQGNDDIHPQSPLWVSGADIFAVMVVEGTPYLGRFDYQLTQLARSNAAIHPFASVLFMDGLLLTQRQDGSALILNPQTLTEP